MELSTFLVSMTLATCLLTGVDAAENRLRPSNSQELESSVTWDAAGFTVEILRRV